MAQYAVNLSDSGGTSLQKELSLTGKALAGLEKQTQGLASAISGLFSSFSLDRVMTQAEKTVKRTTTTVRKQTQKALLSFDEIERIGTESASTTSTTSVTTTTEDTANVSALAAAFTTLQAAIHGALGAVSSDAVVGDLSAIRIAAQNLCDTFSGQDFELSGLEKWALSLGMIADGAPIVKTILKTLFPSVIPALSGGLGKAGAWISQTLPTLFSNVGQAILAALKSGIPGAIAGVGLFIAGLYDAIVNGLDWLSGVLIPAGAALAGASIGMMLGGPVGAGIGALIGLAVGLITDLVVLIVQNWDAICAFFSDAAAWFYTAVIQPVGDFFVNLWTGISQWAVVAWENIKNAFASAWDFFRLLFSTIGTLAGEAFSGITAFLKNVFSKDWSSSLGVVGGLLEGFLANVKNIFLAVKSIFTGVVDFVKNIFSGNWRGAWDSIVSIFKGIWDGIVAVVKAPINAVIGLINDLIGGVVSGINGMIGALNKISFTIPSWVPALGGQYFGFNLSTLAAPKIPYLAQGAVLPANRPFLAVVGDQKHGTNVEAPLDVIKQALAEVLGSQDSSRGNDVINIRFTGELAQLARILQPEITRESNRAGRSLMKGVVF